METVFPVPEFTQVQAVFGADARDYLTREQMGDDFYADRNEFTRHVQSLFFSGGPVIPAGRQWKTGVDRAKAMLAINAWLRSFAPQHEIKIGTVGYALAQWTEPSVTPHQAQRKKPKHKRAA